MKEGWELRSGREDDIRAMYMLDLVCFDAPFRFNLASMRRFVLQPGAIVVVAEADAKLAGFVVVHPVRKSGRSVGYVVTLDVAREFRRMGLAGELMTEAQQQSAQAGAAEMALHVYSGNEAAVSFYEGNGWNRVRREKDFYGPELDAWVYGLDVKSRNVEAFASRIELP